MSKRLAYIEFGSSPGAKGNFRRNVDRLLTFAEWCSRRAGRLPHKTFS